MVAILLVAVPLLVVAAEGKRPRLVEEKPAGRREKFSLGTLFLSDKLPAKGKLPLFIHFHGPGWIAEVAARDSKLAVVHLQLGSGSAVYGKPFKDPKRLQELLAEAQKKSGREFDLVGLTGWSAGYGAVRAILRIEDYYRQVRWVVLMDGLHAGYRPGEKTKPLNADLDCYLRLAKDAVARRKRFLVTHSAIVPGRYASTTETADYLLEKVSCRREEKKGPVLGLPVLSEAQRGGLHVLGCAGTTALDHVDHLHALPGLLRLILKESD
jgi:hypothetical protein